MDSHPELPPFIDTQRLWQLKCPDRFLKECLRPEMIWTLPRDDADGDKARERRVEIVGLKPGTCRWERIDDREIFLADCRRKRLCITIDAGVGKTTALRQIQYLRQVGDNRDGLALCCEFAELPPTWDKYLPTAALGFLAGKLGKSDNPLWRDADPRLFRSLILRKIRSGKFTMLVDALDQSAPRVNAKFDALAACKGLVDFLTNYPQVRFVVSGRPYAIQTYWEPLFERTGPWDIVKVDLFTPAQAKRYVGDERNELLMHLGADVVSIPRSLEMIREIQGDFSGLRTKSDVYWRSLIGMLEKARHLQNPGLVLDESDSLFLFALIAFEMTRRGYRSRMGPIRLGRLSCCTWASFPRVSKASGALLPSASLEDLNGAFGQFPRRQTPALRFLSARRTANADST